MPEGFQALGEILAGGGSDGSQAFADQIKTHGQAADAMWKARRNRALAINREGITPDVVQGALAGDAASQAQLGALILGSATSPNLGNVTGGLGDIADMELRREAEDAARTGNIDLMNRLNAVHSDKLMKRTEITSGQAFDPYAGPEQDVQLTPLGLADLGATNAQAGQRAAAAEASLIRANAAADREAAHAGVYEAQAAVGGFNPNTRKPKKADFSNVSGGNTTIPAGTERLTPGMVMDGYRYKGGDPANPASWERL